MPSRALWASTRGGRSRTFSAFAGASETTIHVRDSFHQKSAIVTDAPRAHLFFTLLRVEKNDAEAFGDGGSHGRCGVR